MNATNRLKNDGGNGADRLRGTVLRQLAALSKMKVPELREKWRELNGVKPPAYNRQYLIRRLAYRIQEMYYGGLNETAKQQLAQVAEADPLACIAVPAVRGDRDPCEPRMAFEEVARLETELCERAGPRAADHDVGTGQQRAQQRAIAGGVEVQHDRFLAGVQAVEHPRPGLPHRLGSADALDLDDPGTGQRE